MRGTKAFAMTFAVLSIAGTSRPTAIARPYADAPPGEAVDTAPEPAPAAESRAAWSAFLNVTTGNDGPKGEPNAWVYVPTRFDPKERLRVVITFHGFHNCLRSFVADGGVPCRQFHSPRTSYAMAAQTERAGLSSIIVVPQLAFDADSSAPKKLGGKGAARAFLQEIIEVHLRDAIGPRTIDDVAEVTLVAASGGHEALGPVLAYGELPNATRVILMDAYYAPSAALETFVADPTHRLALVYTERGPTLQPTLDFWSRVVEHYRASPEHARNLDRPHDVTVDDFSAPISFVRSKLGHDEVMREDLWKALAALRPRTKT